MSAASDTATVRSHGHHATDPVFVGGGETPFWSEADNWLSGQVPTRHSDVTLQASSVADLGTEGSPFDAHDIVGVAGAGSPPDLFIQSFLNAEEITGIGRLRVGNQLTQIDVRHDVQAQSVLAEFTTLSIGHDLRADSVVARDGRIFVDHDVIAPFIEQTGEGRIAIGRDAVASSLVVGDSGRLLVGGDLAGAPAVRIDEDATLEVGQRFAGAQFLLRQDGASLVLDHAPRQHLDNSLTVTGFHADVTLENVTFDGALWLASSAPPDPAAPATGTVELTERGAPVYQLTDVHAAAVPTLSVQGHTLAFATA